MTGKFTSRKFLTMILAALAAFCSGYAGLLSWDRALAGGLAVVLTYIVAQAGADAAAVVGATVLTGQGNSPAAALPPPNPPVPEIAPVVPVGASVVPAGALPRSVLVVPVLPQDPSG